MDHLRLVKRQVLHAALVEDVARQLPAIGFEPFPRAEAIGVVGHVEHPAESDAPGILLGLAVPRFPDQHRHAAIDSLGELGIPAGTEDGAGVGIGIEEGDVLGRQDESALGVPQRLDGVGEENELGLIGGGPQSAPHGEQAKFVVPVNVGEEDALVLEIEQARERSRIHHFLEEALGCFVGGDAGGEHAAGSAPIVQEGPHGLREHGIEVDVAATAKGIAAGAAH